MGSSHFEHSHTALSPSSISQFNLNEFPKGIILLIEIALHREQKTSGEKRRDRK